MKKATQDRAARRPYRMQARQDGVASTRERILSAAYAQWSQRAYDTVTLQSVAEAAAFLPADAEVLLTSGSLAEGGAALPTDTAVWLRARD